MIKAMQMKKKHHLTDAAVAGAPAGNPMAMTPLKIALQYAPLGVVNAPVGVGAVDLTDGSAIGHQYVRNGTSPPQPTNAQYLSLAGAAYTPVGASAVAPAGWTVLDQRYTSSGMQGVAYT